MRLPGGMVAEIFQDVGAKTTLMPGSDIFPALELGTIDAAEFSMPAIDLELGFHQIAKHYYFPGWHQPSSLLELIVNKDRWDALTERQQALITMACGDSIRWGIAEGEAIQFGAIEELKSKGVTVHRWSDDMLGEFSAAWDAVVAEEAAADPDFAKVAVPEYIREGLVWLEKKLKKKSKELLIIPTASVEVTPE